MKARKVVPSVTVRYLSDCAGIGKGVERPLPIPLAAEMVRLGFCEYVAQEDTQAPAPKAEKPKSKKKK